ncbi:MAG: DNA-directed RNA polymerase subunit delta [archaeon]|nr:DNA-directed RNA polymerase subunit delta [archaeon]
MKLKKSDVENLSNIDITYLMLQNSKRSQSTLDLFKKIVELLELPESTIDKKIADYYTALTKDKRFVLIDGKWDLRDRYASNKVIIKIAEDEDDEEINENEEESEDEISEDEDDLNFEEDDSSDDETFDDDEDDGLDDLVVVDDEDMEIEDN